MKRTRFTEEQIIGVPERVNDFAPLVVTSLLSRSVSVGS